MSADQVRIRLEPLSVEVDVPHGASLVSPLAAHGVEFPCGGMGTCGGCGVRVLAGSIPVTDADCVAFPPEKLALGWRLACQARTPEDSSELLVLECLQWRMNVLTDNAKLVAAGKRSLGIAIDLGTTTIAAQILDLATGKALGVETALNPQAPFGTDVMSRIHAALQGDDLTAVVRAALGQVVARLAHGRESQITEIPPGWQHRNAPPVLRPRRSNRFLMRRFVFLLTSARRLSTQKTWVGLCPLLVPFALHRVSAALWALTSWLELSRQASSKVTIS